MKANAQMIGNILGYPCISKTSIAGQDNIIALGSSKFKDSMGSWVEDYLNEELERYEQWLATKRHEQSK